MSRIRRPLLLVAGYVLLIFVVSSIPSLTAPGPDFVPKDKIAHVVEYFILGVLLFKGIGWTVSTSRTATFGFLFAVGASVGALDEIYQSFVPGRMMSILDWYADILGVALGCGAFVFTRRGKHPRYGPRRDPIGAGEGERP
jgi:VanZ family protein